MRERNIAGRAARALTMALVTSLAVVAIVACSGPRMGVSKYMREASQAAAPPPGKSIVYIHRPQLYANWLFYYNVWDGKRFIADLGNGHSVAYVCEPGLHYFVGRSPELVSVVRAELLPDRQYDMRVRPSLAGFTATNFDLYPLRNGDDQRRDIAEWEREAVWVSAADDARTFEDSKAAELDMILRDFVNGGKQERVATLAPEDHR